MDLDVPDLLADFNPGAGLVVPIASGWSALVSRKRARGQLRTARFGLSTKLRPRMSVIHSWHGCIMYLHAANIYSLRAG